MLLVKVALRIGGEERVLPLALALALALGALSLSIRLTDILLK